MNLKRIVRYSVSIFFIIVAIILAVNVYVWIYSKSYVIDVADINANSETFETKDAGSVLPSVALLPGASVFQDGRLTSVLEDRARTAINLYESGYIKKILVSGDGRTNAYDEVTTIGNFLVGEGVLVEDIMADTQGLNTFESLSRAKNVFGISQLVVVSQKFHLYRAIFIGRNLGIDIVGVQASGWSYDLKNIVREMLATVKSVFDAMMRAT